MIHTLLLHGHIDVNCYIVEHDKQCYIIDPGYEKHRIIDFVTNHGYTVLGILLTHGHTDHIGAIDAFDVPVYIHEDDYALFMSRYETGFARYHKTQPYDINTIDVRPFKSDASFTLGSETIEVIHTPGHTKGGVCYLLNDAVFTGDTLFNGSVGKWTFESGSYDDLKKSVVGLINTLDDEIKVYPGHNASSTIGYEKKHNTVYLRWI